MDNMDRQVLDKEFKSPTKGNLSFGEVIGEITRYMLEQPDILYKVIVGTDSKADGGKGMAEVDFVTAIVIHRIGKGGRYFYTIQTEKCSIRTDVRFINETLKSSTLAVTLDKCLTLILGPQRDNMEIHLDGGQNGPTKEVINQAIGIVSGFGFKAKIKPDAFGASKVADRHT